MATTNTTTTTTTTASTEASLSQHASLPEQQTAKSLPIGGGCRVPREQPPRPTRPTTATSARMKLSRDLVAKLSAALGRTRATTKSPPKQHQPANKLAQTQTPASASVPSLSSPEKATLLASQHHAYCKGASCSCLPLDKAPEASSLLDPQTPAGPKEEACTREEARCLQTRDSFYSTTSPTTTNTLLPGFLLAGSPLPPAAAEAIGDAAATIFSSSSSSLHPNGRSWQPSACQDRAAKVLSPRVNTLQLHPQGSFITQLVVDTSQPEEGLKKAPLSPLREHLPINGKLSPSSSELRCPLSQQVSSTSHSLAAATTRHSSPFKQLHQIQNHILFSLQPRLHDKAQAFRKTPVMRRRRKLPYHASLNSAAAICDKNNNNNNNIYSNNYCRRPTCASPKMRPWTLSLILLLLLSQSIDATVLTPNDTTLTGSLESGQALLRPPQQDTDGPFSRFLEFGRIFVMVAIMIGDICGNSLVILSVCRHSKLRVTTNWFVVSLACADILVALFAMTFNASVVISGRWLFGRWVCDFWNSCDVLASTASILHLCCISIDRYIAITRPLDYPMKITTRRVMYALCAVWISSALLSYLPIFTGVYTTAEHIEWLKANPDQCEFTVNRVYAIVSSSVSFWIPSSIMVFTYYRIYREASRQEKFIYKAQSMLPAPMPHSNHHHSSGNNNNKPRSKRHRSKSVAVGALSNSRHHPSKQVGGGDLGPGTGGSSMATTSLLTTTTTSLHSTGTGTGGSIPAISGGGTSTAATASSLDELEASGSGQVMIPAASASSQQHQHQHQQQQQLQLQQLSEEQDSNSGQSTPTKRSISKMKREHKAAKTLGIIMGVFILCWLPFFSWYTPMHICGSACHRIVPPEVVPILFWIGYFNSTLNPIIYAYFNHDFRDAFKKTLQWIFCCCNDLKCLRVNRPNDNQHYNCTYRSTQEIGLVSNS